jgi:hypothetical protein
MGRSRASVWDLFDEQVRDSRCSPEECELARILFVAAMAVLAGGESQLPKAVVTRVRQWSQERQRRYVQKAADRRTHHAVIEVRGRTKEQKGKPPPITRAKKNNRETAVDIAAAETGLKPSAVEAAYVRHERVKKSRAP